MCETGDGYLSCFYYFAVIWSGQAIYKWQHGAALPAIDNLIVLSAVFGVSMDEIIVREEIKAQLRA